MLGEFLINRADPRKRGEEVNVNISSRLFFFFFFFVPLVTSKYYHNVRTNSLTVNCEMRKQANIYRDANKYTHITSCYMYITGMYEYDLRYEVIFSFYGTALLFR